MTDNQLRIAFMGTPDFAAKALLALLRAGHEIVCVYSQPPRPKGRGQIVQKSPVHELAEAHNIPVFTPKSLKSAEAQAQFVAHGTDVAVVAAYGLLLPKVVLEAPTYGCLNIHASLLPRWRGASPIQRAILAGDKTSGVTIMQMDEGLDTGDIITKSEVAITSGMTSDMLHDILADQGASLIVEVLRQITQHGRLKAQNQDEELSTYAHLLKKEDGRINWKCSALEIDRQIRALNPWPSVYTDFGAARFKVLTGEIIAQNSSEAMAGTVLDRQGNVACGDGGVLKILKIQPAGKQAMDFAAAVNGGYIEVGGAFA